MGESKTRFLKSVKKAMESLEDGQPMRPHEMKKFDYYKTVSKLSTPSPLKKIINMFNSLKKPIEKE